MNDPLVFVRREAFRAWLRQNCRTGGGVWLLFGKAGGPKTLKPGEALAMSLSVRKTYVRVYLDAKTDAGRERRLAWITDRLNQNLKPM